MTIFHRALGVAALAGACALTSAAPASADIVGENLALAQLASQQLGVANGNQQSSSNHGSNNANNAQQALTENQPIEVIKNIPIMNGVLAAF
ncbi:hypothetical protein AB0M97_25280 [Streptomyces sp. NPDC051207]|uniref:hypothetical protein n=1 Tax=Streptomyces sp. NPDC051207 TaxID=3154641 RepID=UPI00341337A7